MDDERGEEEGKRQVQQEGLEAGDLSLYINSLKCYLMKTFLMGVRMRGVQNSVKGR